MSSQARIIASRINARKARGARKSKGPNTWKKRARTVAGRGSYGGPMVAIGALSQCRRVRRWRASRRLRKAARDALLRARAAVRHDKHKALALRAPEQDCLFDACSHAQSAPTITMSSEHYDIWHGINWDDWEAKTWRYDRRMRCYAKHDALDYMHWAWTDDLQPPSKAEGREVPGYIPDQPATMPVYVQPPEPHDYPRPRQAIPGIVTTGTRRRVWSDQANGFVDVQ